jgi:hypothetical protein
MEYPRRHLVSRKGAIDKANQSVSPNIAAFDPNSLSTFTVEQNQAVKLTLGE